MKNSNKFKGVAFAALAMAAVTFMSVSAYADTDSGSDYDITFRVEGPSENMYYGSLSVPNSGKLTAADALAYLDEQSDELKFTGVDSGYISQVNDVSAGTFGGWDGWYFSVNGTAPDVGIDSYALSSGDSLVLYYGGYPCQMPTADTTRLNSDGIIKFTSLDTEYDAEFNPTKVLHNVEGAEVTVGGEKYTTNADGEIDISEIKTTGNLAVTIDKKDSTGAPAVLRFAPDFTVNYAPVSDIVTDTDTVSDTDSADNSDSDTDSDSSTSSNTSRVVSTSNNAAKTASVAPASNNTAQNLSTTQTGDGRIYTTVAVLAVVLVVVILMLLLKKKDK